MEPSPLAVAHVAEAVGDPLDALVLREILQTCRTDLRLVRQDAADDPGWRLCSVTDRLEKATAMLSQALSRVVIPAPEPEIAAVLAREADHRIRNSLQTVMTLLEQQAGQSELAEVRAALGVAGTRIAAIAQVHATLHAGTVCYGDTPTIDLADYLQTLCVMLRRALDLDDDARTLVVAVEALALPPVMAGQLGLIVTELVSNAVRHGSPPGQRAVIRVIGSRCSDGSYELCIEDDGVGLPPGFDLQQRSSGLGLRVVSLLARQARAGLTTRARPGTCFTLTLPNS